ncbi:hypothetical protein B0O99DRAFT_244090 [Bisporella sp. PMI_857]|nr:hypothetical protein B0O99DRAFT_244090 [Bisporella sp. PMI_857]
MSMSNDMEAVSSTNSDDRERPSKRIHQACEACRRKKTRCPGEKPACSSCTRLRQVCNYADYSNNLERQLGNDRRVDDRMNQLEQKLDLVLDHLMHAPSTQRHQPDPHMTNALARAHGLDSELASGTLLSTNNGFPPPDVLVSVIDLYFKYCDCQPLPLLDRADLSMGEDGSAELMFAILALTVRFSDNPYFQRNQSEWMEKYAKSARSLNMQKIADGTVQLSTIQSMCLLCVYDFTSGNSHRAWLNISLAKRLAECTGISVETPLRSRSRNYDRGRRCFWSLYILEQICDMRRTNIVFSDDIRKMTYVSTMSDYSVPHSNFPPLFPMRNRQGDPIQDDDIVAYSIPLIGIWCKIKDYVSHRADSSRKAPWSPESEYTLIQSHLMWIDTIFPLNHRFEGAQWHRHSPEELQENRTYWGPWLFVQFVYHAIMCILNHPFLLSVRCKQFSNIICPPTFLKNCSDQVLLHSNWIVRFINMVEEKGFRVTDPFLGHCAAIAATVHLQHCHAEDEQTRKTANESFTTCKQFVDMLANQWPIVKGMAENLARLEEMASEWTPLPNSAVAPSTGPSVDTSLLWEILDYTSINPRLQQNSSGLIDSGTFYGRENIPKSSVFDSESSTERSNQHSLSGTAIMNMGSDPQVASRFHPNHINLSEPGTYFDSLGNQNSVGGESTSTMTLPDDTFAMLTNDFFLQSQVYQKDPQAWWNSGTL